MSVLNSHTERVKKGVIAGYIMFAFVPVSTGVATIGYLYSEAVWHWIGAVIAVVLMTTYVVLLLGVKEVAEQVEDTKLASNLQMLIILSIATFPLFALNAPLATISGFAGQVAGILSILMLIAFGLIALRLAKDFRRAQEILGSTSKHAARWHAISGYLMVSILLSPIGLLLSLVADFFMLKLLYERSKVLTTVTVQKSKPDMLKPLVIALVAGTGLVGGLGVLAAAYPGEQSSMFSPRQETVEDMVMRALIEYEQDDSLPLILGEVATTSNGTEYSSTTGSVDTTSGFASDELHTTPPQKEQSTSANHDATESTTEATPQKVLSDTELLAQIFAASAQADKESFSALNSIDYERIYDPTLFDDKEETHDLLQVFKRAISELSASNIERYYQRRLEYAMAVLKSHGLTDEQADERLTSYRESTEYIRPYHETYVAATLVHMEALVAFYEFMYENYGTYEVYDDGDGAYISFDDEELDEELVFLAEEVDYSAEEWAYAFDENNRAAGEYFKSKGINLDFERVMETFEENYY